MRENHRNLQVRVSVFFVVESGCGNLFSVLLQSFFCVSVEYCLSMQSGNPVRFRNNRPFLYWIPWDPIQETFCVDWVYHALTGECSLFIRTLG